MPRLCRTDSLPRRRCSPIVDCDARNKDSVKMVLLTLLESLVAKAQARAHMR